MKKIIFLFIITVTNLNVYSQTNSDDSCKDNIKIKLKEKANLKITDWIANTPEDTNLNNKFIVLNFWASDMDPKFVNNDHMNELQSKFNNPNLYFITLTNEKPEVVKKALKNYDFKTIVASDQSRINKFWSDGMKNFFFPFSVIIDSSGKVVFIGMPDIITEKIIDDLMSGKMKPFDVFYLTRK